jgi:methylase of polypeptide subunit release factors
MITAIKERIEEKKKKNAEHETLLDIGTGCGVLGISVLLQNPQFFDQIFFCDISEGALQIAEKNYHNLIKEEYQTTFLTSNLTDFVKDFEGEEGNSVILVANLPYIPEETFDNNALEPRIAFVGGDDGLDLYRTMFHQIETHIQNKKLNPENLELFLEMMTWQVDILRKEFKNLTFEEVKTFHFNIRIVKVIIQQQ